MTVYIVSTNSDQMNLVAAIWRAAVPCRLFQMGGDDFYTEEQGRYGTMGTDRLASLRGAALLHGYPTLVFDGGTATTYTAADSGGNILGGGIGPGIQVKFRSLHDYTSALPRLSPEEVTERFKQVLDRRPKDPFPTFARTTPDAMMVQIMTEIATAGRHVIERWLETVGKGGKRASQPTVNGERTVLVTGGDSGVLLSLLLPDHDGIIEATAVKKGIPDSYRVFEAKHLIHYGIQDAVMKQAQDHLEKDAFGGRSVDEHCTRFLNKRVAKWFEQEDSNGDHYFRGSVQSVETVHEDNLDTTYFHILFDDGDEEDVEGEELKVIMDNFKKFGEVKKKEAKKLVGKKAGRPRSGESKSIARKSAKKQGKEPGPPSIENNEGESMQRQMNHSEHGEQDKGLRIAKEFDEELFFGTVTSTRIDEHGQPLWKVVYDDNDEEELDKSEFSTYRKLYDSARKDKDTQASSTKQVAQPTEYCYLRCKA